MVVFEWLPNVKYFCFSIHLRIGCIIIALWCIFFTVVPLSFLTRRTSWYGTDPSGNDTCTVHTQNKICPQYKAMYFFSYSLVVVDVAVCQASIILLVGICINRSVTATIFMYTYTFSRIIYVSMDIYLLVAGFGSCKTPMKIKLICFISAVLTILVAIYVLIVVKSFRSKLKVIE